MAVNLGAVAVRRELDTVGVRAQRRAVSRVTLVDRSKAMQVGDIRQANPTLEMVQGVNWRHRMPVSLMDMVHHKGPWVTSRRVQTKGRLAGLNKVL